MLRARCWLGAGHSPRLAQGTAQHAPRLDVLHVDPVRSGQAEQLVVQALCQRLVVAACAGAAWSASCTGAAAPSWLGQRTKDAALELRRAQVALALLKAEGPKGLHWQVLSQAGLQLLL